MLKILIALSIMALVAGCTASVAQWDRGRGIAPYPQIQQAPLQKDQSRIKPETQTSLEPRMVPWSGREKPGTIVIDTSSRNLYLVQDNRQAIRYRIGVGREGFAWNGEARVTYRRDWPAWCPPRAMIDREPHLKERLTFVADRNCLGMPGGPGNPLGAHALYLFDENGRDTMYRIHGTDQPRSIGRADSSGCIRMLNEHVLDLSRRIPNGAKVIVRH